MNNNRPRPTHSIPHVWVIKRCKNLNKNCMVCQASLGFFSLYEKCRSCKLSAHIDCRVRVNNNCGLTPKHLKELLTQMIISKGQDNWAPEIPNTRSMNEICSTEDSLGPSESDCSFTISQSATKHEKLDRRSWNMFTIRGNARWREDTIPFEEINIGRLIGRGRFGEVYEAHHLDITHVAVKFLDMNHVDEMKRIETFRKDTASIQNARHENLTYFFGYIMDRTRPGIVMELFKGRPLSVLLHDNEESTPLFNEIVEYAKQICQGMSYLHTKRILHKDLRSNNIFIKEKEKIVKITDFGMFNIKRLSYPKRRHSFYIPNNWLCYLAPELIQTLNEELDPIPFSELTDVYSFGTIWYELITNCFPFAHLLSDCIIWQVGRGLKAPLSETNDVCPEAKSLLMHCWSFTPTERYPFSQLLQSLESMPRRTQRRSPSFPLCKSFESMF